mmetsp:Transcript_9003/g.25262  ORF Transcript_9003/g.25262 Transcript_9003/m.25262 type:complete len:204 (-) Transcript_9003:4149-4760(-)
MGTLLVVDFLHLLLNIFRGRNLGISCHRVGIIAHLSHLDCRRRRFCRQKIHFCCRVSTGGGSVLPFAAAVYICRYFFRIFVLGSSDTQLRRCRYIVEAWILWRVHILRRRRKIRGTSRRGNCLGADARKLRLPTIVCGLFIRCSWRKCAKPCWNAEFENKRIVLGQVVATYTKAMHNQAGECPLEVRNKVCWARSESSPDILR